VQGPSQATTPGRVFAGLLTVVTPLVLTWVLGLGLLALPMRRRNGYRGLHEWVSGTKVIRLPGADPWRAPPALAPADLLLHAGAAAGTRPPGLPSRVGAFAVRGALREADGQRLLLGEDTMLGRQVWVWLRPPGRPLPPPRRETGRTTRPRWLGSGRHDGQEWDAFVASPGCLLPDLVAARHRLPWTETLPLLEQLADELAAALADGTLPAELGVGQVWVQTSGRLQLLDTPVRPGPGAGDAARTTNEAALALLRQTARLALEGRPPPEDRPRRVRAPIPRHALLLLDRLVGVGKPFATVAEFRAALAASRELPATVSGARRGIHLVVVALLLSFGLLWTFTAGPLFNASRFVGRLLAGVEAEMLVRRIDDGQVPATAGERERLRRKAERVRAEGDALTASASWFSRRLLEGTRRALEEEERRWPPPGAEAVAAALARLDETEDVHQDDPAEYLAAAGLTLFWPVVWAAWAVLWRGGVSLRLAGIMVVRGDGRRASRLRCGWRVLLAWLPVAGLLTASACLDLWRFAHAPRSAVLAWLAWLTWWLAAALPPLYLWLAQRAPERGPLDRLAGTYLVPR
jgi:eukaryotic-like serine/threonine-protein kinase